MDIKEKYQNYEIMLLDMKILKNEVKKILRQEKPDIEYLEELFLYGCWGDESELVNRDEDAILKAISLLHRESFSIFNAIKKNYSGKVIKKFLDGGVNPNLKDNEGWTALMIAAESGHTQAVQELLKHPDTNPNLQDNEGWTALMIAAESGLTQAVQELLKHPKINPNLKNNYGWTALIVAGGFGKTKVIRELLKHPEIDPNIKDNTNQTVIMWASIGGKIKAVQELLKHPKTEQ